MPRAQDAQEWPAFAGMTILHQKRSQFPRTVLDLRRNDEGLRARPVPDGRRNLSRKRGEAPKLVASHLDVPRDSRWSKIGI